MSSVLISRRAKILGAAATSLGILWAFSFAETKNLEDELVGFGVQKAKEIIGSELEYEAAVPIVTVSRRYILFGEPTAKVALYIRPEGGREGEEEGKEHSDEPDHEEHGHKHFGNISGIEYFLTKENGRWVERESGSCSSEQCQLQGNKAFKRGLLRQVPN